MEKPGTSMAVSIKLRSCSHCRCFSNRAWLAVLDGKAKLRGKKSSGLEVFRTVPWFSYGTGGYILLSNPRAEPAPWRRSACCLLWASCFCRKILNQPRNVRGRWGQVAQPNAKTENCEVIHSVEKSKQSLSRIGRRRRDALSKVNRQSKSSRIKCPIQ